MDQLLIFLALVSITIPFVLGATLPTGLVPISNSDGRIIGGHPITIDKAPYMAQVIHYGALSCGGAIISEEVILTAAHCVKAFGLRLTKIRAGSSYRTTGILRPVRKMIAHEDFVNVAYGSDIGLMWLETPLTFSLTIQKILLPKPKAPVWVGTKALVSGWGYMNLKGYRPNQLMSLEVPIIDRDVCNKSFMEFEVPIIETMICAGYMEGGKDACSGDSGGPLVINSKVVGITSFSILCALPGLPGVYTDVASFMDWVNSKLAEDLLSTNMLSKSGQ